MGTRESKANQFLSAEKAEPFFTQPVGLQISAVIPCYNEAGGLEELVKQVSAALQMTKLAGEIVLIDDGSTDTTWNEMCQLKETHPELCLVKLARNHGHQLALTAGLTVCHASEYVFVLDADLQDPPELLQDMLDKMRSENADVVYGQRAVRDGESAFKLLTAKMFYRFLRMMTDIDIPADTGDFRLMKRHVVDTLNSMPEHARFIRGMVSWTGGHQVPLHYHRKARFTGETKYPLKKMIRLACDAITSFSTKPLKIGVKAGIFGMFFGVLLMVYCLYSYFFRATTAGWTSIVAIVIIFGSFQIFLLGLIGEYIARIFVESQGRPLFMISKIKK